MLKPCCTPSRNENTPAPALPNAGGSYDGEMVKIAGVSSLMGTAKPWLKLDGEGPLRKTKIKPFKMGAAQVTNNDFAAFVADTGYVTEAEKFGWSFVFHTQVPKGVQVNKFIPNAEWWRGVDGAHWRDICGPNSDHAYHSDHPVVHISWNDAQAFCTWAGARLPSEAEWEHAARGGLGDVIYPWGNDHPNDTDHFPCNIWQGHFPHQNTALDGFDTTAPAKSFTPNGYGLYNMVGNCWDWIADEYRIKSLKKAAKAQAAAMRGYKTIKGGSFLCHESYCTRYRIAARTGNSPDSSTSHTSFRVLFDL